MATPKRHNVEVRLKINGEEITSKGKTFEDALYGIKLNKLNTKGVLTATIGGSTSKPVILSIPAIKKLFYKGFSGDVQRTIVLKNIKLLSGI